MATENKRIIVVRYDDGTWGLRANFPVDFRVDVVDYAAQHNIRGIALTPGQYDFDATDTSQLDDDELDEINRT